MSKIQTEISEWASSVFPDRSPIGALQKLVFEEIPELVKSMTDGDSHEDITGEIGDCFILLFDLAEMLDVDAIKATAIKLNQNRARKWNLNSTTGFYNHSSEEK